MTTKEEFLTRVEELASLETLPETEKACRAVFKATRELLQSEDIEEFVSEKLELLPEIRAMWDDPAPERVRISEYPNIADEDTVVEGHEPEEIAIETAKESETVKV